MSVSEMMITIIETWDNISATVFQVLVDNISHRILQVIYVSKGDILAINSNGLFRRDTFLPTLFYTLFFFPEHVGQGVTPYKYAYLYRLP